MLAIDQERRRYEIKLNNDGSVKKVKAENVQQTNGPRSPLPRAGLFFVCEIICINEKVNTRVNLVTSDVFFRISFLALPARFARSSTDKYNPFLS